MNAVKWLGLNLVCLVDCGGQEPRMSCRCGIRYMVGIYYVTDMKEKLVL